MKPAITDNTILLCALCNTRQELSLPVAMRLGWDWFKGYEPNRIEVCPRCMTMRRRERNALYTLSREKRSENGTGAL